MEEIITYIIRFLVGRNTDEKILNSIGYTSDEKSFKNYKLVIKASNFFDDDIYGTEMSLPDLPLKLCDEIPILFGDNTYYFENDTLIINADLIASTYFLISRYEEMVRKEVRDEHQRFPGKESLPYRAGFIDRPIIEEWGVFLRAKLREVGFDIIEPAEKIDKVYLTHDVDTLAHYRNIRGVLGGIWRGIRRPSEAKNAFNSFFGGLVFDPWYTFPYLFNLDQDLLKELGSEHCEIITFLRPSSSKKKEDKPYVNLLHPDYQELIRYVNKKNIIIGMHSSYAAGCYPELIEDEKKRLEKIIKEDVFYNRHHFLNNRNPDDFEHLIKAGITDDFSMGYADMAGFRLGTCKAVKWINPVKKELTTLKLHHLTIMDVTLSEKKYMYMNAHDALQYCQSLIQTVKKFNGEITLLWHNNNVENKANSYHRELYVDLLKSIAEMSANE